MPIPERAKSIIDVLLSHGIGVRPLIFVAHSLGGLMVKQILQTAKELNKPEWEKIVQQTRAVVFIATPHTGAGLVNLGRALKQIQGLNFVCRWSDSAEAMERDCPHLLNLATWYRQNVNTLGIDTIAYYEKAPLLGIGLVVSESSADPGVTGCIPVPIDGDHISIAKPANRGAPIYDAVSKFLRNKIADLEQRTAPQKILLIDDEPAVREALQLASAQVPGVSIQALSKINSRESLLRHLSQTPPDGVILDLDVPPGGTEIRKWLKEWSTELPVVFYTRHADHPDKINQIREVGATYKDIFSKQNTAKDIHSILQRFQQLWTTADVASPDENEIVLEGNEAPTVAEVGKWLSEFTATMHNPEDWEFVRQLHGFGEIRTPDQWWNVPPDREVRVVLLRDADGLVIRWWCDDELEALILSVNHKRNTASSESQRAEFEIERSNLESRIIFHERLATYKPNTLSELRSGYVERTKRGELNVYGGKGRTTFHLPEKSALDADLFPLF